MTEGGREGEKEGRKKGRKEGRKGQDMFNKENTGFVCVRGWGGGGGGGDGKEVVC